MTVERPIEDGYIILTLAYPLHHMGALHDRDGLYRMAEEDDYRVRYEFKDLDWISVDGPGIRVKHKDGGAMLTYSWYNIIEHVHQQNSDEYNKQLNLFQEVHEHNWQCSGEYNASIFPPGFRWFCSKSKDGSDPGCGKHEFRQRDDQDRTIEDVKEIKRMFKDFD
jgi:hypothetical protein